MCPGMPQLKHVCFFGKKADPELSDRPDMDEVKLKRVCFIEEEADLELLSDFELSDILELKHVCFVEKYADLELSAFELSDLFDKDGASLHLHEHTEGLGDSATPLSFSSLNVDDGEVGDLMTTLGLSILTAPDDEAGNIPKPLNMNELWDWAFPRSWANIDPDVINTFPLGRVVITFFSRFSLSILLKYTVSIFWYGTRFSTSAFFSRPSALPGASVLFTSSSFFTPSAPSVDFDSSEEVGLHASEADLSELFSKSAQEVDALETFTHFGTATSSADPSVEEQDLTPYCIVAACSSSSWVSGILE
jgi:hypothetical protein